MICNDIIVYILLLLYHVLCAVLVSFVLMFALVNRNSGRDDIKKNMSILCVIYSKYN